MQKAEYRYYEISQDMPVLVLTGEKWETVYGMDNMHFHNYLEIGYCHYGKGTVQLAERELTYDAGTITFIPRNIPHRTCPDPEKADEKQKWEYLFVDSDTILKKCFADVPEKYTKLKKDLEQKVFVLDQKSNKRAVELMQMIIEEEQCKRSNYKYAILTFGLNLLLFFDRLDQKETEEKPLSDTIDYIRKLINYMELHYMENIMAKDLAKSCELSETHMRRIFLEYTNATPLEYLNLVRINKACELLMKGNCSVESVSEQVGYTVLSTFMRNFKKITGLSPNSWRKKALEDPENIGAYQVSVFKGW